MYKLVLISKYLRRKIAPMFAALAVTVCTMMVIIVISVMGGFLDLLRSSVQQVTGDVIIDARTYTGFPHYQQLIDELARLPQVEFASPIVRGYGLLQLDNQTLTVMVEGIQPREFDKIVQYRDALHWSKQDLSDYFRDPPGLDVDLVEFSMTLDPPDHLKERFQMPNLSGAVLGIEVNPLNRRDDQGQYDIFYSSIFSDVTLTVLPVSKKGAFQKPAVRKLAVLNEFKSGLFDIDANTIFVRFDMLQKMLNMAREETRDFDEKTGDPLPGVTVTPARATEIALKAAAGYTADQAAEAVRQAVAAFVEGHQDMPRLLRVRTWEQRHAQLLSAVKNEKGLVTFLFAFISLVAIVFVAVTFWLIVLEKTRDIGVLRAMGASRLGILLLFVGYGLAIGATGASLGFGLGWLQVACINQTQDYLGRYLGVTVHLVGSALGGVLLGLVIGVVIGFVKRRMLWWVAWLVPLCCAALFVPSLIAVLTIEGYGVWLNSSIRFQMWDPQTYYFDRIPDQVNVSEALWVVLGAIISSVIGAMIPALMASSCEPVESLRYE